MKVVRPYTLELTMQLEVEEEEFEYDHSWLIRKLNEMFPVQQEGMTERGTITVRVLSQNLQRSDLN